VYSVLIVGFLVVQQGMLRLQQSAQGKHQCKFERYFSH